jgi:hypothetical protein
VTDPALVKRILEQAAQHLEGYASGHYMAQSCADELRRDEVMKWIAESVEEVRRGDHMGDAVCRLGH